MSEDLPTYLARNAAASQIGSGQLPPHWPTCLGCGGDNPGGFHLNVRRDGDDVVAQHVFAARHEGAPGIAHGGATATVVDDVLGFLLYVAHAPGVTRRLEVDYLRPILTGVPYEVRASIDSRSGRKVWASCRGTGPDGTVTFTAKALLLTVTLDHFSNAVAPGDSAVAP